MTKKTSKGKVAPASKSIAAASRADLSTKVRVGIVGLPNVGKSTLFNALVRRSQAQAENFPFCTIEPNTAQIAMPDPYLEGLAKLSKDRHKTIFASMEFVDVAGLVAGASEGQGLGNQFLAKIRECEAIVHLLRNYEDGRVVHVAGAVDPVLDAQVVNNELQLADIGHVQRRLEKSNCKGEERDALEALLPKLKEGISARSCGLSHAAQLAIKSLGLLTLKPVLYVFNVSRQAFLFDRSQALENARQTLERIQFCDPSRDLFTLVSARMEARMSKLTTQDRLEHFHKVGMDPTNDKQTEKDMCYNALPLLIQQLLSLALVYTGPGVPPCRSSTTKAYVIRRTGAPTALQMAGKLHGDIQKGFIKAEVISAPELLEYPSFAAAHLAGRILTHGKDYVLQNHDVILVKYK